LRIRSCPSLILEWVLHQASRSVQRRHETIEGILFIESV